MIPKERRAHCPAGMECPHGSSNGGMRLNTGDLWKWVAALLLTAVSGLAGTLWTTISSSVSQSQVLWLIANDKDKAVLTTRVDMLSVNQRLLQDSNEHMRDTQDKMMVTLAKIAVVTGADDQKSFEKYKKPNPTKGK